MNGFCYTLYKKDRLASSSSPALTTAMQPKRPLQLALYYALPFVVIVTTLFLFLFLWERRNLAEEQQEELSETASALLRQIILTRVWNAEHGGVYAEINERTTPNPFLEHPERDIVSRAGKRYTMLNPAYMTRELAALAKNRLGYRFNMTSLTPLNPSNRPDAWEEEALQRFEQGTNRQMGIVSQEGKPVFRYMVPLATELACLKCHAKQYYRVGDIRGGISVSIPMEESELIYARRSRAYLGAGFGLWFSIIIFILLVSYTLSRKVVREMTREIELGRLRTAMEMAGAAAHGIRQPLTALLTYFDLIKTRLSGQPDRLEELDLMAQQCRRIDDLLSKMLNITEYRTKAYLDDIQITDIEGGQPGRREK